MTECSVITHEYILGSKILRITQGYRLRCNLNLFDKSIILDSVWVWMTESVINDMDVNTQLSKEFDNAICFILN